MICPICNTTVSDGSPSCPSCGADLASQCAGVAPEFIFCEGCGARLSPQDRTCPKCGRPAPGILSEDSASSDLAAGKTASFPRLTAEMIAGSLPVPTGASAPDPSAAPFDQDATSVLDAGAMASAGAGGARGGSARSSVRKAMPHDDAAATGETDPYARPHRGRCVALALALTLAGGGAWFVATDPLGVMPGFYEAFGRAAKETFPSRQVPENGAAADDASPAADASADGAGSSNAHSNVSDSVLSEAQAFQRLSTIYGDTIALQDDIGPVVDTYNGQYLVKDRDQRANAARGAYDLRDSLSDLIDEIDGLELAEGSAYAEDVEHLRKLATWTFNRVDVLCRSWDINLDLPEGEIPVNHQDEILAPLRDVQMVDGKSIDVVEYERNVGAWKPVEK